MGSPRRLVLAALGTALAAMLLALWIGAGRPVASPAGIPDPGRLTEWGLPATRLLTDLAGALTVGCLLLGAFLIPSKGPDLTGTGLRGLRWGSWAAAVWSLGALAQLAFATSDILGVPLGTLLDPIYVQSVVTNLTLGRALVAQAVLAALVAVFARFTLSALGAAGVLALSMVAWIPPTLAGHSASSDQHSAAVASLAIHVLAMALWCGGLTAVAVVAVADRRAMPVVVARFSRLALWCVVALVASGLGNASLRLQSPADLVSTSFGRIVLAKAALVLGLVCVGGWHRRRIGRDPDLAVRDPFARVVGFEVLLMAAAVGLGVALSRTPPPVPADVDLTGATAARALLGFDLPPVPTPARLLWGEARVDVFFLAASVLLAALYVAGVRALRVRGDRWPWGRTAAWLGGLVLLVLATSSGAATYAQVLFSAHMLQHMVLNMIVPICLVLGAPVTLALRALPAGPGPRQWLLRFLHSRFVAVISHPLVATGIFIASFYVLYFTSLFPLLMRSHWGHILMTVHFLLAGSLFFWVLIGIDPGPRRPPYVLRVLLLVVAMPLHAFFSIAVMSSTTVLGAAWFAGLQRPYAVDLLADQRLGGGIGWAMGELPIAIVLAVLFVQWSRSDEQQARRYDREADRAESGDGRARDELAEYNAYLASLDRPSSTRDAP